MVSMAGFVVLRMEVSPLVGVGQDERCALPALDTVGDVAQGFEKELGLGVGVAGVSAVDAAVTGDDCEHGSFSGWFWL
jgi:hypothetical protein